MELYICIRNVSILWHEVGQIYGMKKMLKFTSKNTNDIDKLA